MAASMWEVTGLVLGTPGDAAVATEIAQAHGFTPAEVADLLPLYLDNASVDWSAVAAVPALTTPGDDVGQWLADLGERLRGVVDVVSYDGFAAPGLDGLDPGLDAFDELPAADGAPASGGPAVDATFGSGSAADVGEPAPDLPEPDLDGDPDAFVEPTVRAYDLVDQVPDVPAADHPAAPDDLDDEPEDGFAVD